MQHMNLHASVENFKVGNTPLVEFSIGKQNLSQYSCLEKIFQQYVCKTEIIFWKTLKFFKSDSTIKTFLHGANSLS